MCCFYFTVIAFCVMSGLSDADVIVNTTNGPIRGIVTDKANQFLGIPYAVPPVGNNRWRLPQRALPWSPKVLNATSAGPACPQKYCYKFMPPLSCPQQTSEDCLYLNIWTPLDAAPNKTYPVMVFIHGGAFSWGFANASVYDGKNLSMRGQVVLVTLDYRLGVLGFLYSGENPDDAPGNMAIEDQRLALQWVNDNIRSFGGDTKKITLFGQSAGAQSTFIHMLSEKSAGLFRNAIVESSPSLPYRTKQDALAILDIIARHLRCSKHDMACLRSRSSEEVNDAQEVARFRLTSFEVDDYFEPFGPIIDDVNVPLDPLEAAAGGKVRDIPIIMGTVSEECRLFVYGADKGPLPKTGYDAAILVLRGDAYEEIEREYPIPENETDCRDELTVFSTDYLFTCSTRNVTRNIRDKSGSSLYRYVFDHATSSIGGWQNFTFCEHHVCHAEELAYVFQNNIRTTPTKEESDLAESILSAWTNFAYSSDPNVGPHDLSVNWPVYTQKSPSVMYFITPKNRIIPDFRQDYCDFWDNLGYK